MPAIAVLVPSIRRGAEVCSPCVPPGMPHVASRAARVRGCRARSSLRLALARIFPLPLGCRGGEQGERACGVEWSGGRAQKGGSGVWESGVRGAAREAIDVFGDGASGVCGGQYSLVRARGHKLSDADAQRAHLESR